MKTQFDETTNLAVNSFAPAQLHSFFERPTLTLSDIEKRRCFREGRNHPKQSMVLMARALDKILGQPFDGSWDCQARFICEVIAAVKSNGDWPLGG